MSNARDALSVSRATLYRRRQPAAKTSRRNPLPRALSAVERDNKFREENQTYEVLELAVRIHYRAVYIHPFSNGNGRWLRLPGNICLKQNGYPLVRWPEVAIGTESPIRVEYLSSVKKADNGEHSDLIALHQRYLDARTRDEN